ncbi:MAG: HD domain-containing protein [Clostridia bacterium]|nr:HD domain-containing protein [Clostridia bacterium]
MPYSFETVSAVKENPRYEEMIARRRELYAREHDLRDPFLRDYTRVLHSTAFRRLKHKTQVFFSPQSDHICTRIEHTLHVESIGDTIARSLSLNRELTRAIAISHDLGHSPFGHKGERVLSAIARQELKEDFWHEKNGLFFVEHIELLEDENRKKQNLNLTYAVRDGIVSHCGEKDQNHLMPREEAVDLELYDRPNRFSPFTYEGCVIKMADRIAYVGRDLEDAFALGILSPRQREELTEVIAPYTGDKLNNTNLINFFITDLVQNSSPEEGIAFSEGGAKLLGLLREYNTKNIYSTRRVILADKYFELVIREIFDALIAFYDGDQTGARLLEAEGMYESLPRKFYNWLSTYWSLERAPNLNNSPIYNMTRRDDYVRAVLHYISGMSDKYAIDTYHDIISF